VRPATVGILGGGPNRFEATSRTPVCTPVWLMTPLMVLLVPAWSSSGWRLWFQMPR
jgi:hypothetical protein